MNYELFIARRLKLASGDRAGSPSLTVAVVGVVLAIVVMILSIVIVLGFKNEITSKIYCLDAHIKVSNAVVGLDENYDTVCGSEVMEAVDGDEDLKGRVSSMSLTADQPTILKTDDDFLGITYRGVDNRYDWSYLSQHLVAGELPDTTSLGDVLLSQSVAQRLRLKAGDRVMAYFVNDKVKARRLTITGIFSTDFDSFDDVLMMGNLSQIQHINGWDGDTGHFVAVNLRRVDDIDDTSYSLYTLLAGNSVDKDSQTMFNVSNTHYNNQAFFAWLAMLDMNVVVILVLMMIVAGFTLITAMLMIVLDRVRTIGLLKALGATNGSVRSIFVYMTQRLILRALILGNVIGIGLALIQKYFHVVKLDAATYYMPYVPIELHVGALVALNVAIVVISYLTLLGPSHIISTISPTSTMRFE